MFNMCNCNGFGQFQRTLFNIQLFSCMLNFFNPRKNVSQPYNAQISAPLFSGYPVMNYAMPYGNAGIFGFGFPTAPTVMPQYDLYPSLNLSNTSLLKPVQSQTGEATPALKAFDRMEGFMKDMSDEECETNKDPEKGVDLVNQEWRNMADSNDPKTDEKYQELVKAFGKDFIKGIDQKYGNGDCKLTFDEFMKYQMANIDTKDLDAETKEELRWATIRAFARLDMDNDNKLDEKEIAAYLAAMDIDKDGKANGRITIDDFSRAAMNLTDECNGDKKESVLKFAEILRDRYNSFWGNNN